MKVLFVGNGLLDADSYPNPNQGGSVQTWELSRELAKRGHEVFIVRRNDSKGEQNLEHIHLMSIKFKGMENLIRARFMSLPFHATRMLSSLYFSFKSIKMIQMVNPDIICIIDRFSGIFPASLNVRKLYIMHVPEALDIFKPYAVYASKFNAIMFYVKSITERKVLRNVDRIIVLNSFIEGYLREKGYRNVSKIPNGIDVQNFSSEEDGNFILYAGRFDWNKNVCSLVNIFSQIHNSHPNYSLYLVGAGPEEANISALVKKKGLQSSVTIVPWLPRKKLINIMSKCSIFVLPSVFETSSVVVLEAMASSKPVIAKNNIGTRDIIVHGENGFLFSKTEELQSYIELLILDENLRKKMGRAARAWVEENYGFVSIGEKYEELFTRLTKANKP